MNEKGPRFLVVDDEEDMREIVCHMLKIYGGSIMTASNGIEAFQILQENELDMIISDIRMPICDGIELLLKVKSDNVSKLPAFILMTAGSKYTEREIFERGGRWFTGKAFQKRFIPSTHR